ncbi:MAG TPA: DUF489 family protein, partial [Wenzhouxiangella sp.]
MKATTQDRTLALAGVIQAGELVSQVAQSGQCSGQAATASLASIFESTPEDTASVYGGIPGVRLGLRMLSELLGQRAQSASIKTLQVSLALLKLGKQLSKDTTRLNAISNAIELSESAWRHSEDPLDPAVLAQLADAYQGHISSMRFRIKVQGNPEILKNSEKVQLIRSLLLAGLRSAILWQQLGGNQWR